MQLLEPFSPRNLRATSVVSGLDQLMDKYGDINSVDGSLSDKYVSSFYFGGIFFEETVLTVSKGNEMFYLSRRFILGVYMSKKDILQELRLEHVGQ